jgi:hypothetical protein
VGAVGGSPRRDRDQPRLELLTGSVAFQFVAGAATNDHVADGVSVTLGPGNDVIESLDGRQPVAGHDLATAVVADAPTLCEQVHQFLARHIPFLDPGATP